MRISTKGRYALRVMLDLAQHTDEGYISLKTIALRQDISKRYLDQIMLLLNRTEYLQTTRGATGGYKLAHPPSAYSVGAILRLTEGSISPSPCLENQIEKCERHDQCMARKTWQGLEEVMLEYLDSLSLQDILDRYGGEVPQKF